MNRYGIYKLQFIIDRSGKDLPSTCIHFTSPYLHLASAYFNLLSHSYPKWEYKIKNVLEVWCIFLKSNLKLQFQKHFSKILGLAPSPLDPHIFWKKHPRKKCPKVDPNWFSLIFSKNHSKCLKTAIFPLKINIQYIVKKLQFWGP